MDLYESYTRQCRQVMVGLCFMTFFLFGGCCLNNYIATLETNALIEAGYKKIELKPKYPDITSSAVYEKVENE